METKRKLIVIGRAPIKGQAKTRLAAEVGKDWAHRFYLAMLEDFFENLSLQQDCFEQIILAINPLTMQTGSYFEDLVVRHKIEKVSIVEQSGDELFSRIHHLLNQYTNAETSIHLTGTDVPQVNYRKIVEQAGFTGPFLGPDRDGGFYYGVFGKNEIDTFLDFHPASAGSVFSELIQKNPAFRPLDQWQDLDQLIDIKRVCALEESPEHLKFILKSYQLRAERASSRPDFGA